MCRKILRLVYSTINAILEIFQFKLCRLSTSFSQKGEDVFVEEILNLLGITNPNYLDIGANDPILLSNTYRFYLKGFRGVCVEPNPLLCAKFSKKRPKDVVLNMGATPDYEGILPFYKLSVDVLSTFIKKEAERVMSTDASLSIEIMKIPVMPLKTILSKYLDNKVDFLSIDVEGSDLDLLTSLDFEDCRPAVICIETMDYMKPVWESYAGEVEKYMVKNGYRLYADTALNRIYYDLSRVNFKDKQD